MRGRGAEEEEEEEDGRECARRRARKRPTQPPPAMTMGSWEGGVPLLAVLVLSGERGMSSVIDILGVLGRDGRDYSRRKRVEVEGEMGNSYDCPSHSISGTFRAVLLFPMDIVFVVSARAFVVLCCHHRCRGAGGGVPSRRVRRAQCDEG
jgi:hypothetical protein